MHRAERALKKLGIQTTDLIATAFKDSGSSSSSGSSLSTSASASTPSSSSSSQSSPAGSLRLDEYALFWSQVSSARECSVFLLEMLNRFVVLLEKEGKHAMPAAAALPQQLPSSGSAQSASSPVAPLPSSASSPSFASSASSCTLDAFLATLNFIALCLPLLPSHPPLRTWLAGWLKAEGTRDCHHYPGVKEVMRLLQQRSEGQDMMGLLIIGASTLHSAAEFARLQAAQAEYSCLLTCDDELLRPAADCCFYYTHLHTQAHSPAHLPHIVQHTFNKLLTLQQQMRINPVVACTTLSALLHLLHQLLCIGPLPRSYDLSGIISTLQQYYAWPEPVGGMVRDVVLQLIGEAVMGGEMMRGRLMEEVTSVAVRWSDDEGGGGGAAAAGGGDEWGSACFYFVDADERHAQLMQRVLEMQRWRSGLSKYGNDDAVLLSVRRQGEVVMNLLDMEGLMGDSELQAMTRMSDEAVSVLFNQCVVITREVAEQEGEEGERKEYRQTALLQLRDYIHELAASSPAPSPSSLSACSLQPPYLPSLPPVHHICLPSRLTYEMLSREALGLAFTPFPSTPSFALLCSLLQHYRQSTPSDPSHSLSVRLVLAGGDDLLHSFLCAYMLLRQQQQQLLQGLELRLHVLPWGRRAELAAWLARCDPWYARHVYSVFREKNLVLPCMRMEDEDAASLGAAGSDRPEVTAPGAFYRSCVEQYVRESGYAMELIVYRVEAWLEPTPDGSSPQPDHVIPFLQRVEFSSSKRSLAAPTSASASSLDALPELSIRYRRVHCNGSLAAEKQDDSALYSALLFQAVPRREGPAFPVSAEEVGLHWSARLGRGYQRAGRVCVIGGEGRGVVGDCDVRCVNGKEGLHVAVDGQVFGPYWRVRLSPARETVTAAATAGGGAAAAAEQVVRFPVQMFFPMPN